MMSLKEDLGSYIIDLLVEGIESKNMKLAKHFLYERLGYDENQAMQLIGSIKSDIPNVRLAKCKFILAVVRMFVNKELKDGDVIMSLNRCLKYAASDAHVNEYDNDLNGMSVNDFIGRFSGLANDDLERDMSDISSQEYSLNGDYEIVKINSFQESEEYGDYVDWCVTYDQNMYRSYTNGGNGVFYFCLKNGFEDIEPVEGENCPLDEYGLSMIAVSINSDGSCNTITCRWNHANGGNDSIMSTKELSNLLGVNFYEVFKPLTPQEIESNMKQALYEIEEELTQYMGYYDGPKEINCDVREYDPDYGDTDEKDVFIYFSEYNEGCVLIDYNFNVLTDRVYDAIKYRCGDCMEVELGDKHNFINTDGELLSQEWFDNVNNEFEYGVGIVCRNRLWNAIRKDGSFVFDEWYISVRIYGRNNDTRIFELMKKDDKTGEILTNFVDFDGNFLLPKWIEKPFRIDENNYLFKYDGYYHLHYGVKMQHKLKAPYKIVELHGSVTPKVNNSKFIGFYYKITLNDGNDYLLNAKGDLLDINTEQIIYKNK